MISDSSKDRRKGFYTGDLFKRIRMRFRNNELGGHFLSSTANAA